MILAAAAAAQPVCPEAGTVHSESRIGAFGTSGFAGQLDAGDRFGVAVASIGDLDGDGVGDLAVGAQSDDDGNTDRGAVWILFLNVDGSVKSHQKISAAQGGFLGTLDDGDAFGVSVSPIGDLDEDGTLDIAVGASSDDDGGTNRGAVWVLFLNKNGTVKAHQKISDTAGNFTGTLDNSDAFGISITNLGDLDGNGVQDLVVGAHADDDGSTDRGAVWILFMNINGTVAAHQKISDTAGGFVGILDNSDLFGLSTTNLGDLDGDGVTDVVVAAPNDDDGGTDKGALWVLFLNPTGTVKEHAKISTIIGGFGGQVSNTNLFGYGVTNIGDLDGDGVTDIAAGVIRDDDGGTNRGAAWVLFLNSDGTVKGEQKISQAAGGFGSWLCNNANFGRSLSSLGDLNNDGRIELAVGAHSTDDLAYAGDAWILSVNSCSVSSGPCYADCDQSGSLDFFDFLCFQNEFAAGCP